MTQPRLLQWSNWLHLPPASVWPTLLGYRQTLLDGLLLPACKVHVCSVMMEALQGSG
jgi:hypothetical protein